MRAARVSGVIRGGIIRGAGLRRAAALSGVVALLAVTCTFGVVRIADIASARGTESSDIDRHISFDGARQWAQATSSEFDIVNDITISAWVRPDGGCASICRVLVKDNAYGIWGENHTWNFQFHNGTSWSNVSTNVTIRYGEWVHLALTRVKSTGATVFYVNGEAMFTATYTAALGTATDTVGIGAWAEASTTAASSQPFDGDIDDVRLWNRVRSQEQIQTDMNTWGPAGATGLVAYWDFNESSNMWARNLVTSATPATNLYFYNLPAKPDVKSVTTSGSNSVVSFPRSYLSASGGWRVPAGVSSLTYLVVGGGGGGGAHVGGGGGGGGVSTGSGTVQPGAVAPVTVGTAGIGGLLSSVCSNPCTSSRRSTSGRDSSLRLLSTTITGTGGGSGGHWDYYAARSGGSGGGSGHTSVAAGTGTDGQGTNGGLGHPLGGLFGGGGGGAGGTGTTATATQPGNGGAGVSSSITGSALSYGGGGGGGIHYTDATYNPGTGGSGTGGAGSEATTVKAGNGTTGRGGGGGGAGNTNQARSEGGDGGSGVVIVSFASAGLACETQQTVQGSTVVVAFKNTGTCSWNVPAGVTSVDYLVVAGGGGGGSRAAGGGGAGGYLAGTGRTLSGVTALTVTVGEGGPGAQAVQSSGNAGANSVLAGNGGFSTLIAVGGGAGGAAGSAGAAGNGGSGGGAGGSNTAGASNAVGVATAGQGNVGGAGRSGNCAGTTTAWCGGGGGGAGSAGGAGALSGAAGSGGVGLAPSWITATTARRLNIGEVSGSSAYFAGGGGGGGDYGGAAGAGGTGGGGRGSISTVAAVDGLDNSGGGGGGSGYHNTSGQSLGGNGGSGVVVVRYSTAPSTTSASVDSAAVLNGTSQYFQVEEGSAFVSRATYTVESWIRPSAITCSSGAGCPFMLHDGDYAVSIKNSLFQVIAYHSGQGTAQTWTTKAYARLDRWQHVALVRNGSSLQFYVNGDLMDSFTLNGSTRSTYTGYPVKIGSMYAAAEYFSGRVDQWRLWSTARTQGEIQTAMHEFTPSSATGLVAQYDFNGVAGSTVTNSAPSAAANTSLTAYGTPTYEDVKTTSNVENDVLLTFPRSYLTASGGWTVPADTSALSVLAVGGGGGGGTDAGGGGGGGGMRYEDNAPATAGANVTVKVGTGGREGSWGGGAGAGWATTAGQASTVAWGARTYTGGGGNGGQNWVPPNTPQGGTGGTTSGNGSGTNGATGGNGPTSNCSPAFSQGWPGGNGPASSITGTSTNYGGGGGGGTVLDWDVTSQASFSGRAGGTGGGGRGADWNLSTRAFTSGFAGTEGLGGGGGGSHACGSTASHNRLSGHRTDGGAGGSGAVIIRYTPIETCAPVTYRHGVHKVYEFRTTSTCDWTVPTGVTALNYLVVGGGGGGGVYQSATGGAGGGGGGGGLLGGTGMAVTAGNVLTMRVGAGGAGGVMTTAGSGDGSGSSGADSQMSGTGISTVTAVGGGFGGGGPSFLGGNGGSGGGALGSAVTSASGGTGVAGPPRQGYNGGSNNTACGGERPAGGGGGAGGAGGDASCTGDQSGHGGVGLVSGITGVSRAYGGGGGGGSSGGGAAAGVGGLGGGGAGGGHRGFDAIDGLGGGGGGAGYSTSVNVVVTGGAGGDGVIVVRHVDYTIAIVAGNNQTALGNSTLPTNPKVVVRDAAGNGVDGVRVTFLADNGTLGSQSVITSGGGFAETSWTLGATGSQSVTAMMDLVDSDWRIFTATATQASLTYNANNGTSPPAAQSVDAGTTVTVAGAGSMTRAGYTFAGWNTTADGSGTPRSAGSTFVLSSNVTLYAQWTAASQTISYNSNGGTGTVSSTTGNTASSVTLSSGGGFSRSDFVLSKWNTSSLGTGTDYALGATITMPAGGLTLYAVWGGLPGAPTIGTPIAAAGQVTVAWSAPASNGGSAITDYVVEYSSDAGATWSIFSDGVSTSLSATVTGLTNGIAYRFRVSAKNVNGTGSPSSASATRTPTGVTTDCGTLAGTGDPYQIDAGGSPGSQVCSRAFDNSTGTKFINWGGASQNNGANTVGGTGGVMTSILIDLKSAWAVTKIGLTTANDYSNRDPTGITLYGSNTSATSGFTVVGSVSSITPPGPLCTFCGAGTGRETDYSDITIDYPGSFRYYKLKFTSIRSQSPDPLVAVSEIRLYGNQVSSVAVSYDSQGGSSVATGSSIVGGSIADPGSPTRDGYTFAGWFAASSGGSALTFPYAHGRSADFTLYAQWTANTLTVTYDSQGGSAIANGTTVTGGTVAASPGSPTRAGYTFAGWFNASSGGSLISFPLTHNRTADFTLYAQWTANSLTVTFDSQGGSAVSGTNTITGGSISAATMSVRTPTRTGWTFAGWFAASSGGSALTFPYAHGRTADFTLYAQWTANTLTVTYDSQGGSAIASGTTVTGGSIASSPGTPTRAGWTFAGWFTASSGCCQVSFPAVHGRTANFTLYAQWTANTLTVTYDSQLGSAVSDGTTITGGSIASSPGTPTRAGYGFAGWFTASSGGNPISFPWAHGQTSSFTLYAQWTANTLTVTYDSQLGSAIAGGTTVTGGSIASSPGTPTRAGYTFAGWFTAGNGGSQVTFPYAHGRTADFTLYAQWTANTLTVTYDSQGGSAISDGTTITGGSIASSPGTPTRANAGFKGWYTASSGGNPVTFPWVHGRTANFTMYAQWIVQQTGFAITGNPSSLTYQDTVTLGHTGGNGTGAVAFATTTGSVCSVNSTTGLVTMLVGTGTCSIAATKAADDDYYATSASINISASKATQSSLTVSGATSGTYGTTVSLSASGGTTAGAVTWSDGSSTACTVDSSGVVSMTSGSGTCAVTATMAGNTNYLPVTSASYSITPVKATQTALTVTSTSATYGDDLALTVTGGSGTGALVWTKVSGTCTLSGSTLTPGGANTSCVVKVTKATDSNYAVRSSADTSVTTAKAAQSGFSVTSSSSFTTGTPLSLTSSGGQSSGAVSWSVTTGTCTLSGSQLSSTRGGITCTVEGSKAGDGNYLPTSDSMVITVNKIAQTLTFRSTPPNPAVVGATYTVSVDSDVFLAPTVAVANQSQSVCSISVGVVTFNAAGTCLLSANQSGTDVYAAAAASQSVTVVAAAAAAPSTSVAPVTQPVAPAATTTTVAAATTPGTVATTTTTTTVPAPTGSVAATKNTTTTTSTTTTTTTTTTVPADPTQPQPGVDGQAPDLEAGETTALVRGQQVDVSVERVNDRLVLTLPNDVSVTFGRSGADSDSAIVADDGVLRMYREEFVDVNMAGLVPGTIYTVFMFSEPVELDRGQADAAGAVATIVAVPQDAPYGEHTLQVNGVGPDGEMVSLSMGFEVLERTDNTWVVVASLGAAILLALLGGRPIFSRRRDRRGLRG